MCFLETLRVLIALPSFEFALFSRGELVATDELCLAAVLRVRTGNAICVVIDGLDEWSFARYGD